MEDDFDFDGSQNANEVFLSPDPRIPGQNYMCVSFVCPEEFIKQKEVFFMQRFLNHLLNDPTQRKMLRTIIGSDDSFVGRQLSYEETDDMYKGYLMNHEEDIQREFDIKVDYRTNVRGVKVRGVYDTDREAKFRAKQLSKRDTSVDVWVARVGEWIPFNPDPSKMTDVEYNQDALNTLMKKKREADESRTEVFKEDKERRVAAAKKEKDELQARNEALKASMPQEPELVEVKINRNAPPPPTAAEGAVPAAPEGAVPATAGAAAPSPTGPKVEVKDSSSEKLPEEVIASFREILNSKSEMVDKAIADKKKREHSAAMEATEDAPQPVRAAPDAEALFGGDDPWMQRRKVTAEKKDISKTVGDLF